LLNYSQKPVADIRLVIDQESPNEATVYSPDFTAPRSLSANMEDEKIVYRIPLVKIYSVVVL
jgi:hypothetical protein